jgi:hypothetical protein
LWVHLGALGGHHATPFFDSFNGPLVCLGRRGPGRARLHGGGHARREDGPAPGWEGRGQVAAQLHQHHADPDPRVRRGQPLPVHDLNWGLDITVVNKGDFDRDDQTDLLWRHDTSGQNVFWYMEVNGLRDGELTSPPVLADTRWKMVGTHDFNADGKSDILWRHSTAGENVVWLMDKNVLASGTFTTPPALADVSWQMAGTGDFNGDAKPDILWRHEVSGENVAWFMNGTVLTSGTFLVPPSLPDTNWKIVGTGYFNDDVQLDILWWHQGSGQLVAWFMNGITMTGGELTSPPGITDTQWRPVATGDYNRDNREDIVWRHQVTGDNMIWHMGGPNGTTRLGSQKTDPSSLDDTRWKIVGPR